MQCEFTKAELITLDLAVMDRAIMARHAEPSNDGHRMLLHEKIQRLDTLHAKLAALIEQAEQREQS